MSARRAYLDHHATTPIDDAAREAMREVLDGPPGNPSSTHADGRHARALLERARRQLAEATGAQTSDLVFTSGGTEAVHLAVQGLARHEAPAAVWCDPGAHACLVGALEAVATEARVPLRWIPARGDGTLDLEAFEAALGTAALVGVARVQHETGVLADAAKVSVIVRERGGRTVVDAVQALGKVPVDVATLGADATAFSAHKLGGPMGVGALWTRAALVPAMRGGGQERGLRPGTHNLVGAVGFGAAAARVDERLAAMDAVAALRDRIEATCISYGAEASASALPRVATAAHVAWRTAFEAPELVAAFDLAGVSVSAGSACSSGRARRSESMARLFPNDPWRAASSLRVTLGPTTTRADVEAFETAAAAVFPRFGLERIRA